MNEYSVGMKLAQPSRTLWGQCCWHASSSQIRRLRQAVVAWHFWPIIEHAFPHHLGECPYIKAVPQLCFDLWEPSRSFTDMILPYLSTPALSHTRDSPSWASPGIIPTDSLYLWMLIWASKEGVLKYTPMLYTLPPYTRQTPRNVILTGLFSISEHKNHQNVPASSHPFTGRVRTAKTPVSSSPNSLCALLGFVSVFICFRVKNKNLYLVLALWHGGELILPLYREQAEIQIPCRETLQIACSHKRTWWE